MKRPRLDGEGRDGSRGSKHVRLGAGGKAETGPHQGVGDSSMRRGGGTRPAHQLGARGAARQARVVWDEGVGRESNEEDEDRW